jgi:MFS family permease
MSTRAGAAGLLTGLISTIVIYLLFIISPHAFLTGAAGSTRWLVWMAAAALAVLIFGGGWIAARWSGSVQPWRRAVLGALSGALAGMVVFCLWGAAAAGTAKWVLSEVQVIDGMIAQVEIINAVILQTIGAFCVLFLGGGVLGALGGRAAAHPRWAGQADIFDKEAPQMAMNASITAVPASVFAAALAAAIFPHVFDIAGKTTGIRVFHGDFGVLPLEAALLLVLVSHLALTLVVPHEARQAEHRCGTDEVKMAAFVGIAAAPVLVLLLVLIDAGLFQNPLVDVALLASAVMSGINVYSLVRIVLPRRASFPVPPYGQQKTEAVLFGTIAVSRAPRLAVLCTGCGLAMMLPFYVCVVSLLINLSHAMAGAGGSAWRLIRVQALTGSGMIATAAVVLTLIYMFYLNLGRWFRKRNIQSEK